VVDAGLAETDPIYKLENLRSDKNGVIRRKGEKVLCPRDGRIGAAYVDCLNEEDHAGQSTMMLSYGWGNAVGDIIDTLSAYCESNRLDPKRTYIWICCLCNNQHRVAEEKRNGKPVPFEDFRSIFHDRVSEIGHIIALMSTWRNPVYITRVWCIFELYTAYQQEDCRLSIAMPPRDKRDLVDTIDGNNLDGINVLYDALSSTSIQNAQASEPSDRENILEIVESGPGFQVLNNEVNELLRGWIKDAIKEAVNSYSATKADSSSDLSFALLCTNVGYVMNANGEYDQALSLYETGLQIRENVLGKDHSYIANSYNHIGIALNRKNDFDGALAVYRKSVEIHEKTSGLHHTSTAASYNNVGMALWAILMEHWWNFEKLL